MGRGKELTMIEQMLDQLAEYQAQADLLTLDKQKLIDAVKIPDEVLKAQDEANKARQAVDSLLFATQKEINAQCRAVVADLDEPKLPPEYVEAMAAYRAQVEDANSQASYRSEQEQKRSAEKKAQIDADLQAKVSDVYAQVATRKLEISAEFDDKIDAAKNNVEKLTAHIKAETKAHGKTVKGQFYQAVYVKGRVTWITDMLDGMIVAFPALAKARKEGEPSVTLRKI
jgi:hypothetical protein